MRSLLLSLTAALSLLLGAAQARAQFSNFTLSAASSLYAIPAAGSYDGANLHLAPDGAIWSVGAQENVILRLSPDGLKAKRWTLPAGQAPSSLLANADGTFWVTELGGFNVGLFDPATGELKEWPDYARRQSALFARPDGKYWLPETGGPLALFEPWTSTYTYFQNASLYSLSYPYVDNDGAIWSCDFVGNYLVRVTPDGLTARRWTLPDAFSYPSKIIRGFDGALWISVWGSGHIARFDPATSEMKAWELTTGSYPYDMVNYKGRILYSDQGFGIIGFLDPTVRKPTITQTLTPVVDDLTLAPTVRTSDWVTSTLVPVEDDVPAPPAAISTGNQSEGLAEYVVGVGANWGLAVDEANNRVIFATRGYIGTLFPPIPASNDDLYFPSASSISGDGNTKTQLVTWNRATPDSTGTQQKLTFAEQLIPNGWIAGFLPNASPTIEVNQLLAQDDPIGKEMAGPDTLGIFRLEASFGANAADLFAWARVYATRPDGGTYGFAMSPYKPTAALVAGQTGFFFTPPDQTHVTSGGFATVLASTGTVSIVDATGKVLGTKTFSWPGGTHTTYPFLFHAFGLTPVPSARFVVSVASGTVFPFGISADPSSHDLVNLDFARQSSAVTLQWVPAVFRGEGPLGPTTRTNLQVFNPGTTAATVQVAFRSAHASGGALPAASVVVGPGQVLTLIDPLGTLLGLQAASGTLDIGSDQGVLVFARVEATEPTTGGTFGYGIWAQSAIASIPSGSRGVFLSATDNGWGVMTSDLLLSNITDTPTTVTVNLTSLYGTAAGTRDISLGPKEIRLVPGVWYSSAGFGVNFGRIDVVNGGTGSAVFAALLRTDLKTTDTDAILPVVIPK
jgi:streptogramin lyase